MAPTRIGLPDISMTQMEYLVAVQETSTWANAAQALGVSQSALSQGTVADDRLPPPQQKLPNTFAGYWHSRVTCLDGPIEFAPGLPEN